MTGKKVGHSTPKVTCTDYSYGTVLERGAPLSMENATLLANQSDRIIKAISKALLGLRTTAGLSEKQVAAILANETPQDVQPG